MSPSRPALRWHGGKWLLAPWIIEHFPPHRVYVEPYGGAASVLLRKPQSHAEVWNDLDSDVVNLFRVLRDKKRATQLAELLLLTPFARSEFETAYKRASGVEKARRLVIRSSMGFGSNGHNSATRTGFRANGNRSGTTPAQDWPQIPANLLAVAERFKGVVVESRPAAEVMAQHDSLDTLHYVDPPYLPETRSQKSRRGAIRCHAYAHEMSFSDHVAMLDGLHALKGMVVLSGYPNDLYDAALTGWRREERASLADGGRPRIEVLWINPAAAARLHPTLFGNVA